MGIDVDTSDPVDRTGEVTLILSLGAARRLAEPEAAMADAREWSRHVGIVANDADAVERALADADGIRQFTVESGEDTVAAFVYPSEGAEDVLDDALVGVDFGRLAIPDAEGSPEEYVADLERQRADLEDDLEDVEDDLDDLRSEHAGFLLAAEERLAIEVQKAEAPLNFATTERAFVAEGWMPTEQYETFVERVRDAVGDSVDIEEVERADYADYAPGHHGGDHEEEEAAIGTLRRNAFGRIYHDRLRSGGDAPADVSADASTDER